jgi:L-fuculose-phosphate aldolase
VAATATPATGTGALTFTQPLWRIDFWRHIMSTNGQTLASAIVRVCDWMYQKGFIASSEGNVSCRLDSDLVLITPKGVHKGFLRPEHLVVTDMEGNVESGDYQPSSEISLHLAVYHERPNARAVVHAHPTTAVACTLAGVSLADGVIPEVITALGAIPTAPYATPGTPEVGLAIRPLVRHFDAVMLARHGSVTIGADPQDAYSKLEMLEHTAQILFLARLLGPITPLPQEEIGRLLLAGGRSALLGMSSPTVATQTCVAK